MAAVEESAYVDCWIRITTVEQLQNNTIVCHANIVDDSKATAINDNPSSVGGDDDANGDGGENGHAVKKAKYSTVSCVRHQFTKFRITGVAPLVASCIPKLHVRLCDTPGYRPDMSLLKYCAHRRGSNVPRPVVAMKWLGYEWPTSSSRYRSNSAVAARNAVALLKKANSELETPPVPAPPYKQLIKQLTDTPTRVFEDRFQRIGACHFFDGIPLAEGSDWEMAMELATLWGRKEVRFLLANREMRASLISQLELEPLSVITRITDDKGCDFGIDPALHREELTKFWDDRGILGYNIDAFSEVYDICKDVCKSHRDRKNGHVMAFGHTKGLKRNFDALNGILSMCNVNHASAGEGWGAANSQWVASPFEQDRLAPVPDAASIRNGTLIIRHDTMAMYVMVGDFVARATRINVHHVSSWDGSCRRRCTPALPPAAPVFTVHMQYAPSELANFSAKLRPRVHIVLDGAHGIWKKTLCAIMDAVRHKCDGQYSVTIIGTANADAENTDQYVAFMTAMCEWAKGAGKFGVIPPNIALDESLVVKACASDKELLPNWDTHTDSARDVMWFEPEVGTSASPAGGGSGSCDVRTNQWCVYDEGFCKVEGVYMDAGTRTSPKNGEKATHVRIWNRFMQTENAAGRGVLAPSGSVVVKWDAVRRPKSATVSRCKNLPINTFATIGIKFPAATEDTWTVDELCRTVSLASKKIYVSSGGVATDAEARTFLQSELAAENTHRAHRADFNTGGMMVMVINERVSIHRADANGHV